MLKKKLIALMLMLCMTIAGMPANTMTAHAETDTEKVESYYLYVCDVEVTNKNCNDVLGDGKIKYEPGTKTLTLNNVNLTYGVSENVLWIYAIESEDDLTIILKGENTITVKPGVNNGGVIYANGKLNILGTGTLKATVAGECDSYSSAIGAWDNLNIGGSVKIVATSYDVMPKKPDDKYTLCGGICCDYGNVEISDSAIVTAIGGKNSERAPAILAGEDIVIADSTIVTALGHSRAFLDDNVKINNSSVPVKVNTNATSDGAVNWNRVDKLCGKDSIFQYVKIGNEETHSHNNGILVKGTPATLSKNGIKSYYKCHCGKVFEDSKCTKEIKGDINKWKIAAHPKKIGFAKSEYTYTGKAITPKVKVTDSNGKVITDSSYTVTYAKNRKNVGSYKASVKFKGNYSGTKTLIYKIVPKGTTVKTPKAVSKGFTVKWKKISLKMSKKRINGYQVQYAKSAKFKGAKKKNIKGYKKTGVTVKKLAANKKYYVRIRTYVKMSGKTYYSAWSKAKKVKTK